MGVARLTRSCSSYLASSGSLESDKKQRLVADVTPLSPEFVPPGALAQCADPDGAGIAGSGWGAREVFPLAIVYLITLVLDNVLIRYVLPLYLIADAF